MTLSYKDAVDLIARMLVVKNNRDEMIAATKELIEATGYDLTTEPAV